MSSIGVRRIYIRPLPSSDILGPCRYSAVQIAIIKQNSSRPCCLGSSICALRSIAYLQLPDATSICARKRLLPMGLQQPADSWKPRETSRRPEYESELSRWAATRSSLSLGGVGCTDSGGDKDAPAAVTVSECPDVGGKFVSNVYTGNMIEACLSNTFIFFANRNLSAQC